MKRRRTFLLALALLAIRASPAAAQTEWREAGPSHAGVEVIVDLPIGEAPGSLPEALATSATSRQRVRNFGMPRPNGPGLCVFATLDMMGRYQNIVPLIGIIHKIPQGGGYPAKVKAVVEEHAPGLELVQYLGTDPATLDLAMRTGRPVGVTYGYGEFYQNQTIPHMVMLAHLDAQWAAIIDNNDPTVWTWMTRGEFLKRWTHLGGQGWAYVLIAPPPPPPPHN